MVVYFGIYEGLMNDDKLLAFVVMVYVIIIFTIDLFYEIKEVNK